MGDGGEEEGEDEEGKNEDQSVGAGSNFYDPELAAAEDSRSTKKTKGNNNFSGRNQFEVHSLDNVVPGTPADTGNESFDREQILKQVKSGQGYHIGAKESSGKKCSRLLYVC
jgi:hypothetical protein